MKVIQGIWLWLVTKAGRGVLIAWYAILKSETGKFYAKYGPLFIDACTKAQTAITDADYPNNWDRRKARAEFVIDEVKGTLIADMKQEIT